MPTKNHFAVLGIETNAGENEVKKAYRTLAKKWHPDKNKDPGAKEKFQEIAASYEYLSSQDRREMLERELRRASTTAAAQHSQASKPPQQNQSGYSTTQGKTGSSSTTQNGSSSYSQSSFSTPGATGYASSSRPRSSSSSTKSKKRPPHWSDSFKRTPRSQQTKNGYSKASNAQACNDPFSPNANSSYSRNRVSTPSDEEELFEELFGDFFNAMGFGGPGGLCGGTRPTAHWPPGKPRDRPRNVARETGEADGLDDEYLFSPRRDTEDPNEKLPCPWCGQLFTRGKLGQHEEKCGKFGLSADEDEDDDDNNGDDDLYYDSDDFDTFTYYSSTSSKNSGYPRRSSWQQQAEDTRSKIRRDKKRHKDRMASQGTRNPGYVECPYCLREFNSEAAARHMSWCKEHTLKFGRPLNPKPDKPSPRPRGAAGTGSNRQTVGGSRPTGRRTDDFQNGGGGDASRGRPRQNAPNNPRGFPSQGLFTSDEENSPRSGNDKPFPYRGPRVPADVFNINGMKIGGPRRPGQGRIPKVTIGLGPGAKIKVGISPDPCAGDSSGYGASSSFTAQAGRGSNGAFNVRFNLNNRKNAGKPGAYSSSFQNKER